MSDLNNYFQKQMKNEEFCKEYNKLKDKNNKEKAEVIEEDIESYILQFNVDRETAIKEIIETLDYYYGEQDKEKQEVYEGIKREMY